MEEEGRRKVKVRERNAMMEAEVVVIKCEKEPTLSTKNELPLKYKGGNSFLEAK